MGRKNRRARAGSSHRSHGRPPEKQSFPTSRRREMLLTIGEVLERREQLRRKTGRPVTLTEREFTVYSPVIERTTRRARAWLDEIITELRETDLDAEPEWVRSATEKEVETAEQLRALLDDVWMTRESTLTPSALIKVVRQRAAEAREVKEEWTAALCSDLLPLLPTITDVCRVSGAQPPLSYFCPGKVCLPSAASARSALLSATLHHEQRRADKVECRIYWCIVCRAWHLTSTPFHARTAREESPSLRNVVSCA